jgi:hypothetical protein
MRTFAFFGATAIAASLFAAGSALAWTEEKPSQQDQNSVMYTDPDAFKALQDKVNGKGGDSKSGFYITGGVNSGDTGPTGINPYGVRPMTGSGSAFSYSPMPGFRGPPQ